MSGVPWFCEPDPAVPGAFVYTVRGERRRMPATDLAQLCARAGAKVLTWHDAPLPDVRLPV